MSIPFTAPLRAESARAERPVVVVGYDGSGESHRALAVAAERAGPAGTVVAVHVTAPYSWTRGASWSPPNVAVANETARARLAELEEIDTGSATVQPQLVEGDKPAEVLLRVAQVRGAREIVVGARDRGRFRALLGGVSRDLLRRADRPVVIVPKGAVDGDR